MRRLFIFWRQGGRDLKVLVARAEAPGPASLAAAGHGASRVLRARPANLALPVLGAVDDLVLLPLALRALLSALPRHLRGDAV